MKHWNSSETANVCGNCGFQTFSLPVYKRHSKHCAGAASKVDEMSCEFLNGSMKEPLHTISSKEFQETPSAVKSQSAFGKNLLYCKLCEFSCSFSSQLISHIKRIHSNENKGLPEHISSDLNIYDVQMNCTNGISAIKTEPLMRAEEPSTKKKIVLKKIKLEIPTADSNLSSASGRTKESPMALETNLMTTSTPTSVAVSHDEAEEKSRKCPECGFVAKNKDQLMSHRASHEAGDVIYSCSECEYKTPVRKNFERHEWCHIVDSPFKCQFCSFSSNGENAIKRHVTAYHTLQKQQTDDRKSSSLKPLIIPPPSNSTTNWTTKISSELLGKSIKIEQLKKKTVPETVTTHPVSSSGTSLTTVKLEVTDSSLFNPSCSTASSSLLRRQPRDQGLVCPHCGLCYKENNLLENHIKAVHQKFPIQINNLTNRPLIQHDQKQLKKLEVSHAKPKSESLQHEARAVSQSLASQTRVPKGEQRIEIKLDEVRKVYKCGYCSFSVNEFGKLREHMESNACQPTASTAPATAAVTETVLQKLLTNDNPNVVYPKVSLSSFISRSQATQATVSNPSSVPETKVKMEPISTTSQQSSAVQGELPIHPRENQAPSFDESKQEEPVKVSKTQICCLLCTYKTLSVKVLKKHLIRDHPSIICSKKILRDVVQKSISVSVRRVGDDARHRTDDRMNSARKTDGSVEDPCLVAGDSEVLLHMDVQCEAENNPPTRPEEKKVPRQAAEANKFMPFECSECGKRSNWKHVIKKHISDKHEGATVLVLTPEDAESSYGAYHERLSRRFSPKMTSNKLNYGSKDVMTKPSLGIDAASFTNGELAAVTDCDLPQGFEYNASSNHDSDPSASEHLGMSDLLRLKRFKCSVCIYRSNFRCDISRHLKKRHPDINCYYSVMGLEEAKESLPHYRYTWPEAEALLLASSSSTVKEENFDSKNLPGDSGKIDPAVERRAAAIVSRLPFGIEEGKRCPTCPFVTDKAELLRLHMAYHQPQKRNCYSCPHCPYFVNTSRLLQHHITLHENDQFVKSVAAERTATQQLNAYNLEFNYVKRNPKFICEDCPYTNNNRNEFWRHRKGHFERGVVPSDLKCQHCPYWAEDRRDWHLHCSLHGGMQRSFLKKRTDLAIGEFCRCDLADFKDFADLACFKQLRCPSCTVRNPSVAYMRHHMLTHMAFTDAARFRIFDRDFDEADEALGNLCTRLLNMNYSLVEECRSELPAGRSSAEDEETQMPVLEKVTEMSDYSATPSLKISLLSPPPTMFPAKRAIPTTFESLFLRAGLPRIRGAPETEVASEDYEDECILAAPEEVVFESSTRTDELRTSDEVPEDAEEVASLELDPPANGPCPHSKTLFLLSLGILPVSRG